MREWTYRAVFWVVPGVLLCSGCMALRDDVSFDSSVAVVVEAAGGIEDEGGWKGREQVVPEMPADGYDWSVLAHMAAGNTTVVEEFIQEAVVARRKAAAETAWRNPQLRGAWGSSDMDDETPGRSGMRTDLNEIGMPSRPFTNYDRHSTRNTDSKMLSLRFYISNPFVNYWIRKRGESAARALEAEGKEAAYAIFCEMQSLCLEAEILREEIELSDQVAELRQRAVEERERQVEAGLITVLDKLKAEARFESLRIELAGRRLEYQRLLRRIALLAGVELDGLELKPRKKSAQFREELLNAADLVELAYMRRPDLERVRYEVEEADRRLRVARSQMIPWFEFVEGRIGSEHSTERSYRQDSTGYDHTSRDVDEWQVRAAVSLPIFSWLGDEVRLSRSRQSLALVRERGMLNEVYREIEGALYDYRSARDEFERCRREGERLSAAMHEQIDMLADEPVVRSDKIFEAHEEVLRFQRTLLRAEHEVARLAMYLESASGGSLERGITVGGEDEDQF
jgi:outer membrane protein TolC